jgi:hypothetical protein
VTDYAGGPVQTLSKNKSGKSVLDPTLGSFTIEMHLFLADKANSMQVICQKLSDPTHGFSSFIKPTSNVNNCEIAFAIVSGSVSLITSATLDKGKFNHVCLVHDKKNAKNKSSIIVNGNVLSETEKSINFGLLGIEATTFYIGSGSQLTINGSTLTPTHRDWSKNRFVFPEFYGSIYAQCAPHLWEAVVVEKDIIPGLAATTLRLKTRLRPARAVVVSRRRVRLSWRCMLGGLASWCGGRGRSVRRWVVRRAGR